MGHSNSEIVSTFSCSNLHKFRKFQENVCVSSLLTIYFHTALCVILSEFSHYRNLLDSNSCPPSNVHTGKVKNLQIGKCCFCSKRLNDIPSSSLNTFTVLMCVIHFVLCFISLLSFRFDMPFSFQVCQKDIQNSMCKVSSTNVHGFTGIFTFSSNIMEAVISPPFVYCKSLTCSPHHNS